MVMEYASGGELKDYLAKRTKLDELEAFEIFN
jgi:serine/threonine protein kinase